MFILSIGGKQNCTSRHLNTTRSLSGTHRQNNPSISYHGFFANSQSSDLCTRDRVVYNQRYRERVPRGECTVLPIDYHQIVGVSDTCPARLGGPRLMDEWLCGSAGPGSCGPYAVCHSDFVITIMAADRISKPAVYKHLPIKEPASESAN